MILALALGKRLVAISSLPQLCWGTTASNPQKSHVSSSGARRPGHRPCRTCRSARQFRPRCAPARWCATPHRVPPESASMRNARELGGHPNATGQSVAPYLASPTGGMAQICASVADPCEAWAPHHVGETVSMFAKPGKCGSVRGVLVQGCRLRQPWPAPSSINPFAKQQRGRNDRRRRRGVHGHPGDRIAANHCGTSSAHKVNKSNRSRHFVLRRTMLCGLIQPSYATSPRCPTWPALAGGCRMGARLHRAALD